MHINEFRRLLEQVQNLTLGQRKELIKQAKRIESEQEILALLEKRSEGEHRCPRCGHDRIGKWGMASGLQRYRCRECGATFNALTGTPLSRLRHKDKWLTYARTLVEGGSVRKAAERCGVHRNTTFRWRHRFLSLVEKNKPERLTGIVEADETFFRESFKGQKKGMPRPARKRGAKAKKRGTSKEYKPVLIMRDRGGVTREELLEGTDTQEISRALKPVVDKEVVLCADGGAAYRLFAETEGITLKAVNLSRGIRVVEEVFHIQNVNAYHSRLKSWMRRFHGVSTHYLPNYLGWRRLLEMENSTLSPQKIILSAQGVPNLHLMVT